MKFLTNIFFIVLSVVGILIGIGMVFYGWAGGSLSPIFVLIIGLFVVFKEILDIFH